MTDVEFYFDFMCPWAYQTSKWIRHARAQRDIAVTWRFFSLEEVKRPEGKKHAWERPWSYGWSLLRVAALLRREPGGNDSVDQFYELGGRLFHEDGVKIYTLEGAEAVLSEMGRDANLVREAIGDPTTDEDVRADHQRAAGLGVHGVPTLVIDKVDVLFGPVITPAPAGPAAGRLWDAVVAWAEFPHLYEIQRPKVAAEQRHIAASFEPYALARPGGNPPSEGGESSTVRRSK